MPYNVEEINDLIRNRRSVFPKQFEEGTKVDDAIVTQILENATWAPSHGQTEPWRFVVFTGEGLQKLATFQAELYKKEAGENFKEATYQNLSTNPLKASHVIALCLKRDPNKKFPEVEEIAAVSCAVQNMYLTTAAYGVGGYWTTGGVTYKPSAKEFFGLGEDDKLLGFFYLGHIAVPSPAGKRKPIEVPSPAGKRKPIEEKVEWVRG
jgi:nitroreductase